MSKYVFILLAAAIFASANVCNAQFYSYTNIGGNDTATTYADGVPATSVVLNHPNDAADYFGLHLSKYILPELFKDESDILRWRHHLRMRPTY